MYRVNVLMSTYNGEQYLREQIDSILEQEDVDVRLFVRDDGSSDSTLGILDEYKENKKLQYIKGENAGFRKSFLQLCDKVPESDYYAFSDQDDVWKKDKLIRMIKELETRKGPAVCTCDFEMVNEELSPINSSESSHPIDYSKVNREQLKKLVIMENIVTGYGCTQVWNNELHKLMRKHKCGYGKIRNISHDYALGMLGIYTGDYIAIPDKLIFYRQHGDNTSGSKTSLISKYKRHFATIAGKPKEQISIIDGDFINLYGELISEDDLEMINSVVRYNKNMKSRLKLLFNDYCKGLPWKLYVKTKIKILIGRL